MRLASTRTWEVTGTPREMSPSFPLSQVDSLHPSRAPAHAEGADDARPGHAASDGRRRSERDAEGRGARFDWQPGQLLRVDGPVPPTVAAFVRGGIILLQLPSAPGPAHDPIVVDPKWFAPPPPAPERPVPIDTADVLARTGLSAEALAHACAHLGFPRSACTRWSDGPGDSRRGEPLWWASAVDHWTATAARPFWSMTGRP